MLTQVSSPRMYSKEQPPVASGLVLSGVNILSIAARSHSPTANVPPSDRSGHPVLVDLRKLRSRRPIIGVEPYPMRQGMAVGVLQGEACEQRSAVDRPEVLAGTGGIRTGQLTARHGALPAAPDELDGIVVADDRRSGKTPEKRASCPHAVVEKTGWIATKVN
jgi:hypothetical protein